METPPFSPSPSSNEKIPDRPPFPPPKEVLLVLAIAYAASLMTGALFFLAGEFFHFSLLKAAILPTELAFILPAIIYLRTKGYRLGRCLRWNSVSLPLLLCTILVAISLVVLIDELDRLVSMIFPMPTDIQNTMREMLTTRSWGDFALTGIGVILAAALCEESLFRGFVQLSFEAFGDVTRAVLIGALLFSLAHFDPWLTIQILVLGVVLGFLSWRSGSAFPGMLVHGINNGIALLSLCELARIDLPWYSQGKHVAPAVLVGAAALFFLSMKGFIKLTQNLSLETQSTNETPAN